MAASPRNTPEAIVYLGPSMPVADAQNILPAEYHKPVRRGDLESIKPGRVVAIIDGVFEQNLAISPQEVHEAIRRGVTIFGGASMGALRAAEVPGVIGIGRVFDWYRLGIINRDDEVALLFAEHSGLPMTVPSVSVRFAVERLCRVGTIDLSTAEALVAATLKIPYKERTYSAILDAAGLSRRRDSQDLIAMLQEHDIKRGDARSVLEAVDRYLTASGDYCTPPFNGPVTDAEGSYTVAPMGLSGMQPSVDLNRALIWESGDQVLHDDLINFLAFTGQLKGRAANLGANSLRFTHWDGTYSRSLSNEQSIFRSAVRRWGWVSSEETHVTLADLGLDLAVVDAGCKARIESAAKADVFMRKRPREFRRALLADLFLDGLALKCEVMRLGSLRQIARQEDTEPGEEELLEAKAVLSKMNGELTFSATRGSWKNLGFDNEAEHNAFVQLVARARTVARRLVRAIRNDTLTPAAQPILPDFLCRSSPKPPGEPKFSLPIAEAEQHARRAADFIGVTRIGMIGELADLSGIQIAQAARPGNAWSSSYGSGKSLSVAGAVVGSIMEEVEKWAQEQFRPCEKILGGSYWDLRHREDILDPAQLDLPYDTVYNPNLPLEWYSCWDLIGDRSVYVPLDVLDIRHRKHDICFTARGGRKHLATNGLGAGFRREEAILHGVCEYVERHAQRMAELFLSNPGGIGPHQYQFIDPDTSTALVQDLAHRLRSRDATVRVLDITSEIRIPSFIATVTRDFRRADGYGTHPNPDIAIEMALLEAAQTIAGSTAGGREDLSIHARSLGRHERPRPINIADSWFWTDPDCVQRPVADVAGFSSADINLDLTWCLARLRSANVDHVLFLDLTPPGIEPISVVRVIVPGLETNNPFFTGMRARLLLLRDLLPRWQ